MNGGVFFLFALLADQAQWELFDEDVPVRFDALARYDSLELGGNDDGVISEADAIWMRLRVWQDLDANGVPTNDELRTLPGCGIRVLEVDVRRPGRGAEVDVLRDTVAGRGPRANPR